MKKLFTVLILCAYLLSLCGCVSRNATNDTNITFFYARNEADIDGSTDIIVPYQPNINEKGKNHKDILDLYFNGPTNYNCRSPFPGGTTLEELSITRSRAQLTLSPQFATLSGVNLTIACACLTKTVIELTGVNSVQIRIEGATISGEDILTFDQNSFTYLDDLPADQTD